MNKKLNEIAKSKDIDEKSEKIDKLVERESCNIAKMIFTKIAVFLFFFICLAIFTGCSSGEYETTAPTSADTSCLVFIEKHDTFSICYHRDTKVMYIMSRGMYNSGNFCVMLDQDGKPLLYQGE